MKRKKFMPALLTYEVVCVSSLVFWYVRDGLEWFE